MSEKPKKLRAALIRLLKITAVLFPISWVVFSLLVKSWAPFDGTEESVRHILEWMVVLAAAISVTFLISLLQWKGPRDFWTLFTFLAGVGFVVIFSVWRSNSITPSVGKITFFSFVFSVCGTLAGMWLFAFARRNFRKFIFGLACLITLIALAYAEEDWRGWHDWQKYKHEQEAKGEKLDFKDFVPPPVPDNQNFALTPIVSTSWGQVLTRDGKEIPYDKRDTNFVSRLKMDIVYNYESSPKDGDWTTAKISDLKSWRNYYRELAAKTNEFPVASQSQSPAQDVLLALSKYDSTIEELRAASKLPYSRFPLEWDKDDPAMILLPHLAALKQCSLALQLRAIAELQNGESEKAFDDVQLTFRLIDSVRTEPVIISQLVRIAMTEIIVQPIYEGLAEHKWSEAQLVELDSELAKLDFLADYEFSMRGERVLGISETEYLRRSRNLRAMAFDDQGDPSSPPFSNLGFHLAPASFFYQNELNIARMHQEWILPLVDVTNRIVSPKKVLQNDLAATKKLEHGWPYNILARMTFPAISGAIKRYVREQSVVDLARVAIALERYRLANGDYPNSLDALAPQFMEKIPNDIIGGQPLIYRRTNDGQFILYSVGWNETDDGGVVGQKGNSPVARYEFGDLVWRYPQK